MFRKIFLLPVIVLILSGCGNRPDSGNKDMLTIATLKGPSSMGMIKLIDTLGRGGGQSVKAVILNEPLQVRKMMMEGSADFAILPTTMAAIVYNKGMKYRVIAIPVWGTLYLSGSDTTVSRWEDLRGKRVFVMARGMTPDVLFRYLLMKNGIVPDKDITLDYSFPTHIDLANAVAARQASLGVISEPLASLAMHNNRAVKRIFSLEDEWNRIERIPLAETAFMAKTEVIKNHPGLVERVISAYAASTEWVNLHPDSAARLIVKYNILPDSALAADAIPRSNLRFAAAAGVWKEISDYLSVFYRMNPDIVGGKMPDEEFIYR